MQIEAADFSESTKNLTSLDQEEVRQHRLRNLEDHDDHMHECST